MKKYHFMSFLLTIALITTAAPLQAESNMQKAKNAAKKQFDQSIKRLQKCRKGNCSRMEALKAARDVTIAIVAMYAAGRGLQDARQEAFLNLPKQARYHAAAATAPLGVAEKALMLPLETAIGVVERIVAPTVEASYQSKDGKEVTIVGIKRQEMPTKIVVREYGINPKTGQSTIVQKEYTTPEWYRMGFVRMRD